MKKILLTIFSIVLLLAISVVPVYANPAIDANVWVYDSTDILSDETIKYINSMNEGFYEQNGQPKFAIVFTKDLPEKDIDAYMKTLFQEYGMSYADDSYDVLVYIAINDKKYDMEYGGGYNVDGAFLIHQDLTISMFGEEVKALLMTEEYDDAVMEIAKHFEKMMERQQSGYYVQAEARRKRNTLIFGTVFLIIAVVGIAFSIIKFIKDEKAKEANEKETKSEENTNDVQQM